MTIVLYVIAGVLLIVSLIFDKKKTKKALKVALNIFKKMVPLLLITISLVSVTLFLLPDHVIAKYLGENDLLTSSILASLIGSISIIPGFVTFPLCGLLLKKSVSYMVLAAFSTSLMMVGIITFPMEKKFFGTKLTITRNIAGYLIAVIVSIAIGIIYGEVF
jgi:uncharacterized membrane protein YraQ (UPF0718 family)